MITFASFLASYSNSFYLEIFLDKGYSSLSVFKWDITNIFLIKVLEGRVKARAEEKVEGQYLDIWWAMILCPVVSIWALLRYSLNFQLKSEVNYDWHYKTKTQSFKVTIKEWKNIQPSK